MTECIDDSYGSLLARNGSKGSQKASARRSEHGGGVGVHIPVCEGVGGKV